nr:TlpA family protein disulfide reductase [Bacteroidota bacterium]
MNHLINISFPQITGDQIRRYDLSDPQYLNTTFEDIVKKYKGNVIYIDFWASWCKPCLEQIPFVKELQRTYKEEKIVFMFISLDCNTYTWNQLINHANQGLNF